MSTTPYIEYESIDVLLSLQHPRSGAHDEMTFYISGQVIELLFKLAVGAVHECQARLDRDDLASAGCGRSSITASFPSSGRSAPN